MQQLRRCTPAHSVAGCPFPPPSPLPRSLCLGAGGSTKDPETPCPLPLHWPHSPGPVVRRGSARPSPGRLARAAWRRWSCPCPVPAGALPCPALPCPALPAVLTSEQRAKGCDAGGGSGQRPRRQDCSEASSGAGRHGAASWPPRGPVQPVPGGWPARHTPPPAVRGAKAGAGLARAALCAAGEQWAADQGSLTPDTSTALALTSPRGTRFVPGATSRLRATLSTQGLRAVLLLLLLSCLPHLLHVHPVMSPAPHFVVILFSLSSFCFCMTY